MTRSGERGALGIEYVGLLGALVAMVLGLLLTGNARAVANTAEEQICRVLPLTACGTRGDDAPPAGPVQPVPMPTPRLGGDPVPMPTPDLGTGNPVPMPQVDLYGTNLRRGPSHQDLEDAGVPEPFDQTLAGLAARDPDALQRLIQDNGDGTYTVTFYDGGTPVPVTVPGPDAADLPPGGPAWPTVMGRAWDQFTQDRPAVTADSPWAPNTGGDYAGYLTGQVPISTFPVPDLAEVRTRWDQGSAVYVDLSRATWRQPDQRPAWMFSERMVVTDIDVEAGTVMLYDPRMGGEPRQAPWSQVQEYMDITHTEPVNR